MSSLYTRFPISWVHYHFAGLEAFGENDLFWQVNLFWMHRVKLCIAISLSQVVFKNVFYLLRCNQIYVARNYVSVLGYTFLLILWRSFCGWLRLCLIMYGNGLIILIHDFIIHANLCIIIIRALLLWTTFNLEWGTGIRNAS